VNLKNFFAELKRRNVYKVAIAYGVVAWLLIQVATQVFPLIEIPPGAVVGFALVVKLPFHGACQHWGCVARLTEKQLSGNMAK